MVRDNHQSVHSDHPVPGLRDRVFRNSTPKISGDKFPEGSSKIPGHEILFKGVEAAGGNNRGTSGRARPGFLLPYFPGKETDRKIQDDLEPKTLKQVSQVQEVQNGLYFFGPESIDARLLHGVDRFKGRLPAHPDLSAIPKIPQVCGKERGDSSAPAVQGSAFRALILTPGVYQGDGGSLGPASSAGSGSGPISRRPVIFCPVKGKITDRLGQGSNSPGVPGVDPEPSEIITGTCSGNSVSRISGELSEPKYISTPR